MEETFEQKKRRLFGKQYLGEYKKTISKICKSNYEILSIVDSDKIFKNLKELRKLPSLTFPFNEKVSVWKSYKYKFIDSIYLMTKLSDDCGIIKVKSIDYFNIDFDFFDESEGMIVIANEDLTYKLLLDFYEDNASLKIDIIEYVNGNDPNLGGNVTDLVTP